MDEKSETLSGNRVQPDLAKKYKEKESRIFESTLSLHEKTLPPNLEKCIEDLKVELNQYLESQGLGPVDFPQRMFYVPDVKLTNLKNEKVGGVRASSSLVLGGKLSTVLKEELNSDPNLMEEVSQAESALYAAHELFHATGLEFFVEDESIKKPNIIERLLRRKPESVKEIRLEKSGVYYNRSRDRGEGSALEEGMAQIIQNRSEGVVEKHFPKAMAIHKNLKSQIKDYEPYKEVPEESIDPFQADIFDGRGAIAVSYPDSVTLVHLLMNNIDNFEGLVMRARVKGEVLPLARVFKEKFSGESGVSWSRIMTATEENAAEIKNELERVLENKSREIQTET